MPEPPDVYCDQFQVNTNPYGCSLNFFASPPTPPAPGAAPQAQLLVTVRMSLEHLKLMTFILHRQMRQYESNLGVTIPIPVQVLNALQIGREDWDAFWSR
jgi:hypothetical protein